jgi:membrane-associated phospholipid phosphatase
MWIYWLIVILKKRKELLPLVISSFIFTTIFTQIIKYFILPNEKRPSAAMTDISQMHFVEGVTLHSFHSFPSGHTATAFTFLLLLALTVKRLNILILSFIAALLIAYSRIYLGQHFPLDIGGGIIVSICSVSLSVFVQTWFERRRLEKAFLKAA